MLRSVEGRGATVALVVAAALAVLMTMTGCTPAPPPAPDPEPEVQKAERVVPTHGFVRTTLGHVHYLDTGPETDVPIVLLHQIPRSIDEFKEVIPLLAEKHRVIAVDTPGYGRSDKPSHPPTVEEYVDGIIDLLDALGVAKAHFVGHHTGAFVAMEMAAAHPERLDKLVLSGPVWVDDEIRKQIAGVNPQWHVQPDGSHFMQKWERFLSWTDDPQLTHRIVLDLMIAGEISEWGHEAAGKWRMEDRLSLVKGPTLIIVGKQDRFATPEKNRTFAKTIPNSKEVYIEGGIFLANQNPEGFAREVLDFL